MPESATVHIVDDDPAVLRSLQRLLCANGYKVKGFASARAFLAELDPDEIGCLILDRQMPDAEGHAVHRWMIGKGLRVPVIFLTGEGDIASSVRALKSGAVDYLTKPVASVALFAAVERALALDRTRRAECAETDAFYARLDSLTDREREVMYAAVAGRLNKQIAHDLGIVEKTVKVHRARMMQKMGVRTFADLVRKVALHRDGA
jgi:FixJ family two-component response regulator